jgi:hypothetical protein
MDYMVDLMMDTHEAEDRFVDVLQSMALKFPDFQGIADALTAEERVLASSGRFTA